MVINPSYIGGLSNLDMFGGDGGSNNITSVKTYDIM